MKQAAEVVLPLLVGCAGWRIPAAFAAQFAPGESHLQRYAGRFPAVEINSSFYRPHRPQTYTRWAESVPPDFRFSVKLPRTISHDARLAGCEAQLTRFAAQACALGAKLGCILVQLPPSLAFHAARDHAFFTLLRSMLGCMVACEARHPSWFDSQATSLLVAQGVTRVQADPPAGLRGPFVATTAAAYLRWHGYPTVYYSSYSDRQMADLAQQLGGDRNGATSWCIFDNTASGAATGNALALLDFATASQDSLLRANHAKRGC